MLAKTIQIIAGLLGMAVKSFALALLVLEVGWGVLLASLCFWIAGHGSLIRGIIAAILAFVLVTIVAVVLSTYFAAISVVRKAVADAGIGKIVFDRLFEHVLGVAGDQTHPHSQESLVPVIMPASEVKAKLTAAARLILAEELPSTNLAGPFFWLVKQIEKIAIWATVKVVVKACSKEGDSVNLYDVRDRMAGIIDGQVVNYVKQYFVRIALLLISLASSLAVLVAIGLWLLPG